MRLAARVLVTTWWIVRTAVHVVAWTLGLVLRGVLLLGAFTGSGSALLVLALTSRPRPKRRF